MNGPVYAEPHPAYPWRAIQYNVLEAAESGNCFHVVLTTDARLRWADPVGLGKRYRSSRFESLGLYRSYAVKANPGHSTVRYISTITVI